MKVIVAGSREVTNFAIVEKGIRESGLTITAIISGKAAGADTLGERYADENNIPVIPCPADWDRFGLGAGYIRNNEMAKIGDALIAFWDGQSKGTAGMISIAKRKKLVVVVVMVEPEEDMPCHGGGAFWEENPKLWEKCKREIAEEMIAAGWSKHARKFGEVQRRKAMKLFLNSK